ncbi:MAG: energy transducer TonB [Vicinamibacteria bacterium]
MLNALGLLVVLSAAAVPAAAVDPSPVRLVAVELGAPPFGTVSGGITAFDVTVDEHGAVSRADCVQDLAPYSDLMRTALPAWRFEPAHAAGAAVTARTLVLGFFRPPSLTFAAPSNPRYHSTEAPPEVPWPTSVAVPPYPPNAQGAGLVILEIDISAGGKVTGARVVTTASAFDGASTSTARAWTFRPAQRNGRPVTSRAYLVFSFPGVV